MIYTCINLMQKVLIISTEIWYHICSKKAREIYDRVYVFLQLTHMF
jgi:hypothetical protein